MNKLAFINNIHIPTVLVALVAYILGTFAIEMNGKVIDISTPEGRGAVLMAIFTLVIKFLQASPVTPTKA
jgi:hypothetical protein